MPAVSGKLQAGQLADAKVRSTAYWLFAMVCPWEVPVSCGEAWERGLFIRISRNIWWRGETHWERASPALGGQACSSAAVGRGVQGGQAGRCKLREALGVMRPDRVFEANGTQDVMVAQRSPTCWPSRRQTMKGLHWALGGDSRAC
jgi:hypothetical protein